MRCVAFMAMVALSAGSLVQLHGPSTIPAGWRATAEKVNPSTVFRVNVGVKRSNGAALKKVLEEVSEPLGEKYLQYPTYEEVGELVRPSAEATRTVRGWLAAGGVVVTREHPHGDYIHGEATAAQLEAMAHGEFVTYVHDKTGMKVHRLTSGVRVPAEVAAVVDIFVGFHGFPLNPVEKKEKEHLQAPGAVVPQVFRNTYNVTAVRKSGKRNIQAIAQFQGQYVDNRDLATFCTKYDAGATCKISKYLGLNKQEPAGVESMLDTEYIMAIGETAETWVYSYPNFDFCGDLTTFGSNVTGEATHPHSISISYGSQRIDFCPSEVITRLAQDVQKMGTMGITVMISSGDDGSGGNTRQGSNGGRLSPSFPASIPDCIAVGSTYWVQGTSGEEEATTQFGSGGGFSYDYEVPSYQAAAVKTYLENVRKPNAQYAANGRGSPDVAALGESFTVVENGMSIAVGGTSASSPSFAGLVTMLNEVCLAESGKTLGYANPLFYQNPHMFTDIVKGTNAIGYNQAAGWEAIKGWDAATGLGTPNFGVMAEVVKHACRKAAH